MYITYIDIIQQYQNIFFTNNLKIKIDRGLYLKKKKLLKIKSFTIYFKLIKINKKKAKLHINEYYHKVIKLYK